MTRNQLIYGQGVLKSRNRACVRGTLLERLIHASSNSIGSGLRSSLDGGACGCFHLPDRYRDYSVAKVSWAQMTVLPREYGRVLDLSCSASVEVELLDPPPYLFQIGDLQ